MIPPQPRSRAQAVKSQKDPAARKLAWPTYLGITALLLLFVVALAGGIIWYNSLKTTELMVAATERQMIETGEKISERIGLLYDPLYAIVAIASQVPEMKAPLHDDGHTGMPMLLRALRFYPQILSLYVGFDNGDFFMVSHIAGEDRSRLRIVLEAPEKAAFANEIITAGKDGARTEGWIFLDDDGVEVGRRDVATTSFDPRERPWYGPARHSDLVQRSDLYIFASNNEPGFSLSRSFTAAMPGVLGADLAASDLSHFLSEQRVTPTSVSFIFTRSGEIVAFPDRARVAALVPSNGEMMVPLPKLTELNEPAAAGLFAAYQASGVSGTLVYTVAHRTYIGRIIEIAARYGRDQLLAIAVPIDEIEGPIIELRNRTLFYSIAVLVFVLPLYVTLIVAWLDRRLGRSGPASRDIKGD
jgi:adenylate cyclase